MKNYTYMDYHFGWFLGSFENNQNHRHYAIQLSIPLDSTITVNGSFGSIYTQAPVLIQSNIPHQIATIGNHFLLLINPASTIGHFWKSASKDAIHEFSKPPVPELKSILLNPDFTPEHRKSLINETLLQYDCYCSSSLHHGDERINKALLYLQEHVDRIVPLEEIAEHCHLSKSRFLHLFKEETRVSYRRAQLWYRIIKALRVMNDKSFTETAYETGFADSAHFSRTLRENFGFSPRQFAKLSQFIQVSE